MTPTLKRKLLLACGYVAAYLLLGWLCDMRPALAPGITPWHPQTGLTLAFLLMTGPRWLLVCVLANLASLFLLVEAPAPLAAVSAAVWIAAVYAGFAFSWQRLPAASIPSTADAVRFASASTIAALLGATGYVMVYVVADIVAPIDAARGIARYSLADLNGVLMVAPLFLASGARRALARAVRERLVELVAQFALILAIFSLIFAMPDGEQLRFLYLLFVPVIWMALRWGWAGALPGVLVIQSGLLFAAETAFRAPQVIDSQVLMLTLTLTALLLGSVVAERRLTEARLRERDGELARAMRFAVAGELASATAHELNQPITALVSYLDAAAILARSASEEDPRLGETVRKAAGEALRASKVLQRLRNFYAGGGVRRESIDPVALCQAVAATFAERLRRDGVTLEVISADSPPRAFADETQLHIVLHNLVSNAIDAVTTGGNVQRRIEVRVEAKDALRFIVEDSGPGIDPAIADRLFDAFVTSKSGGMGLGLAISRSLVQAAGGDLSATTSTKLGGARFEMRLS